MQVIENLYSQCIIFVLSLILKNINELKFVHEVHEKRRKIYRNSFTPSSPHTTLNMRMRMCIVQCREPKKVSQRFQFKRRRQGFVHRVEQAATLTPLYNETHRNTEHFLRQHEQHSNREGRLEPFHFDPAPAQVTIFFCKNMLLTISLYFTYLQKGAIQINV